MASYCCFWCPSGDFSERALGASCSSCGRPYNAPLLEHPAGINGYSIDQGLTRGFYSAVYRATQQSLQRTVVLKVVPRKVYEFFGKDWTKECEEHAAIAKGTPFVADITDQFDADVMFRDETLACHVAVLENIDGPTLEQLLASPNENNLTPRTAAQIAIDLFEILHLFSEGGRNHNDLHPGNLIIQQLTPQTRRSGGIDPNIRAVGIDLGSVLDASRSGDHHVGDQQNVAREIAALSAAVHKRADRQSDVDYRIASALRGLAEHLAPAPTAQRVMSMDDALKTMTDAMKAVDEPWRQPLSLNRFGESYNAQTLESWYVPELWIDPQGKWLKRTTARGPQVITGMRGCGKTMLLRALHFHARAAQVEQEADARNAAAVLAKDHFLGVYASCSKLLNPQNQGGVDTSAVALPFERLYVAYLRDAVQVLRHLRSLDLTALLDTIDASLGDALKVLEFNDQPARMIGDEQRFEQFLIDLEFSLADGKSVCRLKMAPAEAFGHLASVIRNAAPALRGKYVLFLLDDVSTRWLKPDMVREVISQLLFQHPRCAFRITTEAQALHRVLLSPGGGTPADPNRDYEEFDLGNEVYRLLQDGSTSKNMEFISEILRRRGAKFQDPLYRLEPLSVLGDVTLEEIANDFATSSDTSPERKEVYRGLRAVQAVCVGDLGDVVKLYEKILERATIEELPVPAKRQSDAFLEHSANLMHILNRRDQHNKGLALAFAQAAGELLHRSKNTGGPSARKRLRQYTKLYVRVDAGQEFEDVTTRLLDLLDAGVFVYDGGVPRTKTRDDDPVLQMKLSYRKILGLASFIGLADRDRFELSGETLRQWLKEPENAKTILIDSEAKGRHRTQRQSTRRRAGNESVRKRSKSKQLIEATSSSPVHSGSSGTMNVGSSHITSLQLGLGYDKEQVSNLELSVPALGVDVTSGTLDLWKKRSVDAVLIARGFEERTLVSAQRLLAAVRPRRIVLVEYGGPQGDEIASLVRDSGIPVDVVTSIDQMAAKLDDVSNVIIDSSGLSKPFLFVAVRNVLERIRRASVVHTLAEHYYPSNEDLSRIGVSVHEHVPVEVFSGLENILLGEAGPYEMIQVHRAVASPDRWRALLASASPKNDRLLHLLDSRDYDATRIFVPPPTTPRRCFARAAAELSASVADTNVALVEVGTNDIRAALQKSEEVYKELYHLSGANIEIGLTGSKVHAIAFAALAAAARISAAWYVRPQAFDFSRFTKGVGETHCFELSLTTA